MRHSGSSHDEAILRRDSRKIQDRGSDGGAIYIKKDELEEFNLSPGHDSVNVGYVLRDGSVTLVARADTPGGFNQNDLLEFAIDNDWSRSYGIKNEDGWAYTFKNSSGEVEIEVDSHMMAGEEILENVSIIGPTIKLDRDLEAFSQLSEAAKKDSQCRIEISDNEGVWERFKGSNKDPEIPDRDMIQQLVNKVDVATARLVATRASVLTTLEEIQGIVELIRTRSLEAQKLT